MANLKHVKVCVFDFDGTLVDTMGEFADIAAHVLEKNYGMEFEHGRRRYLETSGIPFFQQLQIICPGGEHNDACAEEFERTKLDGFFDSAPSTDTLRGLESLKTGGLKTVVSSNNFQSNVDEFLKRHPMPLDLALGFDDAGMEKGEPHFRRVRQVFGVEAREILFCGDSLKDGERADASGVHFVGITGTFTSEQFEKAFGHVRVVSSIPELVGLLERESAL